MRFDCSVRPTPAAARSSCAAHGTARSAYCTGIRAMRARFRAEGAQAPQTRGCAPCAAVPMAGERRTCPMGAASAASPRTGEKRPSPASYALPDAAASRFTARTTAHAIRHDAATTPATIPGSDPRNASSSHP